jgi:bis(5'-nucleosyl)-tetraphosphatase (symmetrical)
MSTYAIGDIQGCQQELISLLDEINFDESKDRLWFTGDLVNRGPDSLETLRFVKNLGDQAITVLGNHDLHLLAIANGQSSYMHKGDTLKGILEASDKDELLTWLRQCPLLHQDENTDFIMVHAGLAPQWTISQAKMLAVEVELVLRGNNYTEFFTHMYGNEPDTWSDNLQGWKRLRVITNYLTRLRYCENEGKMDFSEKNTPGNQAAHHHPWFEIDTRASANQKIIFGHWAALRNYKINYETHNVYPLDSGCLWGGRLTALRLEDEKWFSVPSVQKKWSK